MKTASKELKNHIKKAEGFKLTAYKDAKGVPTIGYGHTKGVKMGTRITKAQADKYLEEDLAESVAFCNKIPELDTQGKFDAVVDFVFNVGVANFRGSTLYRKIKARAGCSEIQAEFRRWIYCGQTVLNGLKVRREWEAKRWAE